jgi:hypothetical protein
MGWGSPQCSGGMVHEVVREIHVVEFTHVPHVNSSLRCPSMSSGSAVLMGRRAGHWVQVNIPKTKKSYCKGKACKKHQMHKVTQYKTGKASLYAQGTSSVSSSPAPDRTARQETSRRRRCRANPAVFVAAVPAALHTRPCQVAVRSCAASRLLLCSAAQGGGERPDGRGAP